MNAAVAHLEALRRCEFERVRAWFGPGTRVLELGGGSGYQASLIAATGAYVRSLDLPNRDRTGTIHWNVEDYDGLHVGAPDASFDVVYTSNVLEHIETLDSTLSEIRRVLRPGGVAIHVLPSASWRLWTSLGHPAAVARAWVRREPARSAGPARRDSRSHSARSSFGRALRLALVPDPHGEYPSASSELWYFSRLRWRAYFAEHGWRVTQSFANGLFYTGWAFLPRLPLALRRVGARLLGSSTRTFVLTPVAEELSSARPARHVMETAATSRTNHPAVVGDGRQRSEWAAAEARGIARDDR